MIAGPKDPTGSPVATGSLVRISLNVVLTVTAGLLALWFWSRLCRFPSVTWNDLRLAPTIALAQGLPVYPTANSGTINTWMYGPLPLVFFWPASWASSAGGALMIAAGLNIALALVPLAVVCFAWPTAKGAEAPLRGRLTALLLGLALWPELHYSVLFADNLAIACGLIGNLILMRGHGPASRWLAAGLVTATLACKQITWGMPVAQILWLGLTTGWRQGIHHAARCAVVGLLIGTTAIAVFGWEPLWFTLVEVPRNLGWAPDLRERFRQVAPALALQVAAPASIMIVCRRAFLQSSLLLPALAWLCTLPLGVAAMMKVGGWTNSLHGFELWLPVALVTLLTAPNSPQPSFPFALGLALAAAAIFSWRITTETDFPLRPQLAIYQDAAQITRRFPGAVWFPLHPLVTLYSDHAYYHDEDGMHVRIKTQRPLAPDHIARQLPPAMQLMAFLNSSSDWGIARQMLPPDARSLDLGNWTLRGGLPEPGHPPTGQRP